MQKIILCKGIPGSGKSTWAKEHVVQDPDNWVRVNNDDLRSMMNGSVYSSGYEKMITDTRNYIIRDALKRGKNVIIDNLNLNKRHFEDVSKIAKSINANIEVSEKTFYIDIDEAIARDSKREGNAKVGESVIRKWWKDSGKQQFKTYVPKVEVFQEKNGEGPVAKAPSYNTNLSEAVICDLDGTLALIHNRSPYDAKDCDIKDLPNIPVIETIKAMYKSGRQIIFCSGREDKFRPETIRFIEKHCQIFKNDPNDRDFIPKTIEYQLFMRKTDDMRKDSIIKEEIYQERIEGKYNVLMILDDRNQVVDFWRSKGLICFQVAPGDF